MNTKNMMFKDFNSCESLIAEGNIDTPQKAKRVIELGCYTVVVGGAITRPQLITRKFVQELENK